MLRTLWIFVLLPVGAFMSSARAFDVNAPDASTHRATCAPAISPEAAIAAAVNEFSVVGNEVHLRNPRHEVMFGSDAVTFTHRRAGLVWRWELSRVTIGARPLDVAAVSSCAPRLTESGYVAYERGRIIEKYLAQGNCIEQQFVIPAPLSATACDLEIIGRVDCAGDFQPAGEGWTWAGEQGVVSLGRVRAFDANGDQLAASLTVCADETRILLDGEGLAHAEYPVTIDPEIGTNDFRISVMGPDGDIDYDAHAPVAAYNPAGNEYLVVWYGDDDIGTLIDGEYEIFVQRIDATTGIELGINDQRISDMGPDGEAIYDAITPAVAYNSTAHEYLVVWSGEEDSGGLVEGEMEIFGQRLGAADASEIGTNDFRISDMGVDGIESADATRPAVAFNNARNEYLVVWDGDAAEGGLADNEYEIYGQRLDGTSCAELGMNDFRISDMGPDGDPNYDAREASVVYNATAGEYLVVWEGDDGFVPLVYGETEIFGQRLAGDTGAEIGTNDFRISDMGPDGDPLYDAVVPAVACDPARNEYLVIWEGDDNTYPLLEGEREIFGQFVSATGTELGTNDFRISDMGTDGAIAFDALSPYVCYNAPVQEYLVVWEGDDTREGLIEGDFEVFGQRISALTRLEIGINDFLISDMGPDSSDAASARVPIVGCANGDYLVAWSGDDTGSLSEESFEIYAQFIDGATGTEIGANDFVLSDMGTFGDIHYDASTPAVVYNPVDREYFVVWYGEDDYGGLVAGESEIFGRRIHQAGFPVADKVRLSDMGPDGNPNYDALHPSVAYNGLNREYLVVWTGDDSTATLVDGEYEIFGQRIAAATGAEVGANDFRITDAGFDGDALFDAGDPDVVYNSINNEYLVVWAGDDNINGLVDGEYEVFGQRLAGATGAQLGGNDFRISDMGPYGDPLYDARPPAVAYNRLANEYLVVWAGEDDQGGVLRGENEIFCQRLSGSTGAQVGLNDFRISDMGGIGDVNYDADEPDVVFNAVANEYLVVWHGDDIAPDLANDEIEVYGQLLEGSTGIEKGQNDFRVSDMGPALSSLYDAKAPSVACDPEMGVYLVVWHGDDDTGLLLEGEYEIFGQLLAAGTGLPIGENDFRLSDMGIDGDILADAFEPVVALGGSSHAFLVAWEGDDGTAPLVNEEFEIFGQMYVLSGTSVPDGHLVTNQLSLRVTPQPVRSTSVVEWVGGSGDGSLTLQLFDVQGQLVRQMTVEHSAMAAHRVSWNDVAGARALPSGTYFLKIRGADFREGSARVLVVR